MLDCILNFRSFKRGDQAGDHRVLFFIKNLLYYVTFSLQNEKDVFIEIHPFHFAENYIRAPPSSLIFNF